MLTVRYFASLRETLGYEEESITLEQKDNATVADLVAQLSLRGAPWDLLEDSSQVLVAVDQSICQRSQVLRGDEEVAFFPPMTGG